MTAIWFCKALWRIFLPGLLPITWFPPEDSFAKTEAGETKPKSFACLTYLDCDDPDLIGKDFHVIRFPTYLGRSGSNDIVIPEAPVSRNHAKITTLDDQIYLHDLGSKFGTYVNGEKLRSLPVPLMFGDKIRLGVKATLRFGPPKPVSIPHNGSTHGDNQETMIRKFSPQDPS